MAEHDEHPPEQGAAPRTPADRPVAEPPHTEPSHAEPPHAEPPHAETLAYGPPPREGRVRRWARNGSVRMGAVTLVAGLVGGLVGGGIVAAFSDDGHDGGGPVRFDRRLPRGGPEFGRRYWGPPGGGFQGRRFPQQPPPQQPPPTPVPSPKATG